MKCWTFYDYLSESGRNVISYWITSQPAGTSQHLKSALNTLLMILEGQQTLGRPTVGQLRGAPCKGLYELVLTVDKIQFRPIGCFGPADREFTLLVGAIEKDRKLIPGDICDIANRRKRDIAQGRHVRVHGFD